VARLDEAALRALVVRHDYRAIAAELVQLERDRGEISIDVLNEDPTGAIEDSSEISIEYDTSLPRGCSVYGYYRYRADAPATIYVHPSWTTARDSFTIVHEYGHHVQPQHPAWANVRFSFPNQIGLKLEERVADAFAAEVLVPADMATADTNWLDARTLATVHSKVRASRSAVAMRAVEIAPSNDSATVVVCDRAGTVIFSRSAGDDVFSPAKGAVQPELAKLIEIASRGDGYATGPLTEGLRAASGWIQTDLVAEVAADYSGFYAFAVIRSAQKYGRKPTWEQLEVECPNPACEHAFVVDSSISICLTCGDPKCPHCSTCSCESVPTAICDDCFMALSLAEQSGAVKHVC
jgi:hypothetical protein